MFAKTTSPRKEKIYSMLQSHQLVAALAFFHKIIHTTPIADISGRFDTLMQTFRFLSGYFLQGKPDPHRETMLASLKAQFIDLLEEYFYRSDLEKNPSLRFSTARSLNQRGISLEHTVEDYSAIALQYDIMKEAGAPDMDLMQKRETLLKQIFDLIWSSLGISRRESELILNALESSNNDRALAAAVISALMLSLLENPVTTKMKVLLKVYDSTTDDFVAARALTAIIVILATRGEHVVYDPEIRGAIESWEDSLLAYSRVREVVMALIRAYDTERVSNLMRTNVMPELMKLQPKIRKLMTEGGDLKNPTEGFNPEWEEMLDKTGLSDKLRQMSEIQQEGGDIMMDTFASLKQHPFFRDVCNWFLPFERYRSEYSSNIDFIVSLTSITDKSALFCDSDKFSLALSINRVPEQIIKGMRADLETQLAQANEDMKNELTETSIGFSSEVRNVVKCLYRFYRLYPRKNEFCDVFSEPLLPDRLPIIDKSLFDSEFKKLIYEFFFRNGYYAFALPYLESVSDAEDNNAVTYQKIGFCYQKAGDYPAAIEAYRKAEILDSRNNWLRTAIGWCHMELGNYEAAAKFYEEALDNDPESVSLLRKAGAARLAAGDPDSALAHFYKVYYLQPSEELSDAIGWAEFMRGDYKKCIEYEQRAIDADKGGATPYVRAAHAQMALGNVPEAWNLYSLALGKSPNALDDIWEDHDVLLKAGINESDLELIQQFALWKPKWPLLNR